MKCLKNNEDKEYANQDKTSNYEDLEESDEEKDMDLEENKKYTRIGNKIYDEEQ